jgi:hypothetical protein
MDWRVYQVHGNDRGAGFYGTTLEYGHYLWHQRLPARAILCLDRAMGADLDGTEPVLGSWPMPYAAVAWVLREVPRDLFCGNPRVHFQHYADRMNDPRRSQRQWRAWACWAIARQVRPELPGDSKHQVIEPSKDLIAAGLAEYGLPGEVDSWEKVLSGRF